MTLRTRIAAAAGLAVALAVAAAAVAVYLGVRGELRGEVDDPCASEPRQSSTAAGAAPAARSTRRTRLGPPGESFPRFPLEAPAEPFGGPEGFVQLVLPGGRTVRFRDERERLPVDERARAIAREGSGEDLTDTTVDGTHLRVLTAGLGRGGAIQVARPLDEIDRQLDKIVLVLLVVGAGGVALGAALGAAVASTALAPIARFTRRTEELAADPDPSERIEVVGRDELARLAGSFNTTLDALESSVEAQRHLVADASHELRTPIASLRANIQTLEEADRLPPSEREALRSDIVEELDELTALVADIVELARGAKPVGPRTTSGWTSSWRPRSSAHAAGPATPWPSPWTPSPRSCGGTRSASTGRSPTWLTTRSSGVRPEARSSSACPREANRARPRAGFLRRRPGARVRALLPSRGSPWHARVGVGPAIVRQAAEAHGGSVEAANARGEARCCASLSGRCCRFPRPARRPERNPDPGAWC